MYSLFTKTAITIITKVTIIKLEFYRNNLAKVLSLYIRGVTFDHCSISVAKAF